MSENLSATIFDREQFIIDLTRRMTEYLAEHPENASITFVRVGKMTATGAGGIAIGVAIDIMVEGESWEQAVASQVTAWAVGGAVAIGFGMLSASTPILLTAVVGAGAAWTTNKIIDKVWNWCSNNSILSFQPIYQNAATLALPPQRVDPFILDLDGDGIETIKVATGVNFDLDNNGFSEQSGWVNGDDGLLALDRNGDGLITDGTELFGDQTILQNGNRATNGFQALAEWDANADGKIDSNDEIWASLKVWRDVNSDGISSVDELFTLDQLGIASVGLVATNTNVTDTNGNTMTQSGSFTRTDGTLGQTGNYLFSRNTTFSTATDWLPETSDITGMPDLQGYGTTYTLHQAMLRDTSGTLKGLVDSFAASTDETTRKSLMDQIIYAWTNSSGIDPASRGAQIDARKLHALEMLFGQAYWGASGANPNSLAAPLLNQAYQGLSDTFYAQLMAQTHLKPLYDKISYFWNETSNSLNGDLAAVIVNLKVMIDNDPVAGFATFADFTQGLDQLQIVGTMNFDVYKAEFMTKGEEYAFEVEAVGKNRIVGTAAADSMYGTANDDAMKGGAGNDLISATSGNDFMYGGAGNDTLYGGNDDDMLYGGTDNDILYGDAGTDILYGDDGVDYLSGGTGNDILDGGNGNDTLQGGQGDDTYVYRAGSGNDSITSYEGVGLNGIDTVLLEGLNQSDFDYLQSSNNLILRIKSSGETLTLTNWFTGTNYQVDSFKFADGSVVSAADMSLTPTVMGTELGDVLYGSNYNNDVMYGLGGVDTMCGYGGNDFIDGGAGNDTLYGGNDDDLLRGGTDNDILYGDAGTDILYGDEGVDNLKGGTGNDILDGGSGNDTLQGGQGDDTYVYRAGSGNDNITSYEGVGLNGIDTVVLEGLNQSDLDYRQSSNNLILRIKSSGETLTLTNWFTGIDYQVDNFKFADSSVVSAAEISTLSQVVGTEANDVLYGSNYNNDVIYGLGGVDTICGYSGNDFMDGGAGNDTLYGGNGNDTYSLGYDSDSDIVNENDTTVGNTDIIQFHSGIATDQIWFRKIGTYDLEASIIGTNDKFIIKNWYSGSQYHVEQFKTSDGKTLLDSQVANLVNAMAAFTPPSVGQTTLPQNYQDALTPILAANWQ